MAFDYLNKIAEKGSPCSYFKPGDIVTPKFANYIMDGKVVEVDPKIGKVYVDFEGEVFQMDPFEITISPIRKNLLEISGRVASRMVAANERIGSRIATAVKAKRYSEATDIIRSEYPSMSNVDISRIIEKLGWLHI